ncbi:MAG TPA: DUF3237 domain-containing protein [Burkholderiales bacterium]|nr:DUF3237 domain-containing protein [Burkholderiales bacterium]
MRVLQSEHLMQMSADLDDPLVVPDGPAGTRRILYARRGTFAGARLRGELLPGGGDWVLQRSDGIAALDIRFVLRTDDGQLIYVTCGGLFDISPEIRERIRSGGEVDPSEYYFRTVVTFETGAEKYRWLNRLLAVGIGRRTPAGMVTEVFAIK